MSILGGGGELCFCNPSSGNVYEVTTPRSGSATIFDSTTSRCAISIGSNADTSSYAEWAFSSATTTPNIGFMGYGAKANSGGTYDWIHFLDSTNTARAKVTVSGDVTGSLQTIVGIWYLSGTSWVVIGSATVNMGLQKLDVSLSNTASGYFRFYVAKNLIIDSGTVDLSGVGSISKVRVRSVSGTNYVSEMILADAPTTRLRGYIDYPTASGSDSAWTGTYADVDEITYSDVDGLQTGSAGNVTMVTGCSPTLGGFGVEAVIVGARGALGTAGPTKVDLALRRSTTNYFSSDVALSAGYGACLGIWATDPSTSAAWVASNATAAQFGVKSIA